MDGERTDSKTGFWRTKGWGAVRGKVGPRKGVARDVDGISKAGALKLR